VQIDRRPSIFNFLLVALLLAVLGGGERAAADCAPADINDNGVVDAEDLALVLAVWGTNNAAADINHDGMVEGADLTLVLGSWGPCEPPQTTWTSQYSSGNRTSIISITKSPDLVVHGALDGMIDGNDLFTDSNSFWFNNENVANKFIRFELLIPQIIDAFQIVGRYDLGIVPSATHNFQGSHDGVNWITLKQFEWKGNTGEFLPTAPIPVSGIIMQYPELSSYYECVNVSFFNDTAYQYYQFVGVSGDDAGVYQTEVIFKGTSCSGTCWYARDCMCPK